MVHSTPSLRLQELAVLTTVQQEQGYIGKVSASNSLEAELLAIIKGMEICLKSGFQHVIIGGYCLSIPQSLQKYNNLLWTLMAHWQKLLHMLS